MSILHLLVFVLILAVISEISIFVRPFGIPLKKHVCFFEPPNWHVLWQPLAQPIANYDANYYYQYVPHHENVTEWCSMISTEIANKFNAKFTCVCSIYHFRCKHTIAYASCNFQGPPVKHFIAVVPMHSDKLTVTWKKSRNVFKESICITPMRRDSYIDITGLNFLVAIVQPFSTWNC